MRLYSEFILFISDLPIGAEELTTVARHFYYAVYGTATRRVIYIRRNLFCEKANREWKQIIIDRKA